MGASAPQTVDLAFRGPITRDDLPGLSDRICALLSERSAGVVLCDVLGVEPDAVTADALCRLQLAARRNSCQVRLRHASDELLALIAFMGLTYVLPDQDVERVKAPGLRLGATTAHGPPYLREGHGVPDED
jgi:ABC-type transporter Mla MlaB component